MEINKQTVKNISKKITKSFFFLLYLIFVISLIVGGIIAGIMTLIPDEASKPCYLGYYAHCSFTPYSTLILFAMAIVGTILLLKLIKYTRRQYNKLIETRRNIRSMPLKI
ncbi:MAG: hypothetical protein ACFFDH_06385 [Promethearchaeota archaeon]